MPALIAGDPFESAGIGKCAKCGERPASHYGDRLSEGELCNLCRFDFIIKKMNLRQINHSLR